MYAGWPYENAGIRLGPEIQSHVRSGALAVVGNHPLFDEEKNITGHEYFWRLYIKLMYMQSFTNIM